jgi:hypothetical protein
VVELELPARRGGGGVEAAGETAGFDDVHTVLSHAKNGPSNSLAAGWRKVWQKDRYLLDAVGRCQHRSDTGI